MPPDCNLHDSTCSWLGTEYHWWILRLQVVNAQVLHISYGTKKAVADRKSYITDGAYDGSKFQVSETNQAYVLQTGSCRAMVDKVSGYVSLYDADGKMLVTETPGKHV